MILKVMIYALPYHDIGLDMYSGTCQKLKKIHQMIMYTVMLTVTLHGEHPFSTSLLDTTFFHVTIKPNAAANWSMPTTDC